MERQYRPRSAHPIVAMAFLAILIVSPIHICAQQPRVSPSNTPVEGGSEVTGMLTTEDGRPVAGGVVFLLRRGSYYGKMDPRSVKSDVGGFFKFDRVGDGEFRLWSVQGNLSSREKRLQGVTVTVSKTRGAPEPAKLVMKPGRTVHATILSADGGKPVPGAFIRLTRSDIGTDFPVDARGAVTIQALTAEEWELSALAPGKAKVVKAVVLTSDAEVQVDFTLSDGGSISGKVVDAAGKPVSNVGVNIYPGDSGRPSDYVTTADDGTYKLDNIALDQEYSFYINHDSYVRPRVPKLLLASADRNRQMNVTLEPKPPGGSIMGKVLNSTNQPMPGATVTYYGTSTRDVKTIIADTAGAYRLDGIQIQKDFPTQIVVRAAGWAPQAVTIETPGTAESPSTVDIRMTEKGHRIRARLINDKGEPVKNARIEAGHLTAGDNNGVDTDSDAEGRFQFDTLRDRATFNIYADGYTSVSWEKLPLDGEDEVTVILQRVGAIIGKVIDAQSGAPLPKFNIKIRAEGILSARHESGEDFGGGGGTFRLDSLRSGEPTTLIVSAPGYPSHFFENLKPTPGGEGDPAILKISKNPDGYYRIAGTLLDADGKPVAGAEVRLVSYRPVQGELAMEMRFHWSMVKSGQLAIQDSIRAMESARTAKDGTFSFPLVPGPDIDLVYWGNGVPQERIQNVGRLPVEQLGNWQIRAARGMKVGGKIDPAAYSGITKLELRSTTDHTFEMDLRINEGQTSYEFPAVPAGSYTLRVLGKVQPAPMGGFTYTKLAELPLAVEEGVAGQLDLAARPAP